MSDATSDDQQNGRLPARKPLPIGIVEIALGALFLYIVFPIIL
jgi:hypothetical protein